MKALSKLWIWLIILAILSPLGLLLPERLKAGDAWGEWQNETIKELIGYIPAGMEKLSCIWSAPFSNYSVKGWQDKGAIYISAAYIISAIIGVAFAAIVILAIGRLLSGKDD